MTRIVYSSILVKQTFTWHTHTHLHADGNIVESVKLCIHVCNIYTYIDGMYANTIQVYHAKFVRDTELKKQSTNSSHRPIRGWWPTKVITICIARAYMCVFVCSMGDRQCIVHTYKADFTHSHHCIQGRIQKQTTISYFF